MVRDDEFGEVEFLVRGCGIGSRMPGLEERGPGMAQSVGYVDNCLGSAFACVRDILGRDILHFEEPLIKG